MMLIHLVEEFSLSKEGHKCEDDCPKACHHVDYETSLSYAKLPRNVLVEQFLSFLNATPESPVSTSLYEVYRPLANMTKSERQEYIELVHYVMYLKDSGPTLLTYSNQYGYISLTETAGLQSDFVFELCADQITGSPRSCLEFPAVIQVISCGLVPGTHLA